MIVDRLNSAPIFPDQIVYKEEISIQKASLEYADENLFALADLA
jgi:hypothetical protein